MDINYELYKVFYYVAISLSFSEASKQLFISQSAVSQSIKTLEKKLGISLFIRSTKRVQLTPEGETLLRHIEPAMNLIKRGENQIMEASNLGGGQLRIGASDTICRYYLVPFLNKFHNFCYFMISLFQQSFQFSPGFSDIIFCIAFYSIGAFALFYFFKNFFNLNTSLPQCKM